MMPGDLESSLADWLRVRRSIYARTAALEPGIELSIAQLKALLALQDSAPMTVGQLARRLGTGLPAASLLVDKLAKAGWVVRADDTVDRRRVLLQLTADGQGVADRFRMGSAADLKDWMAELSDADFAALARGLRALARVASRNAPAAEISA